MEKLEFKGTKGKWVTRISGYKDYCCVESVENNKKVNDVWWVTVNENLPDEFEKQKANAKLIAAAPDLLKSSIKMSKAISNGDQHLLSEANLELKTAINKALK